MKINNRQRLVVNPNPGFLHQHTKLWASVIRRAAVDYVLYRNHKSTKLLNIGLDAEAWLFGSNHSGFQSFESVCDYLGLSPSLVRKKITQMTPDQARRRGMEFGED